MTLDMSMTCNTPAIVIAREDWNGDDCRVTLYTRERGKVEAIARGLRKAKSKLAAHLEPVTTSEVFLVEGKRFPILAGSSVANRHLRLRDSYTTLCGAGLLMRLVDLMTPLENRDDAVFDLVEEALAALEYERGGAPMAVDRLTHLFAWKLMIHSGYHPELRMCVVCRRPIDDEKIIMHARRGGVVHAVCEPQSQYPTMSLAAVKGLAYMSTAPLADAMRLRSLNGGISEMLSAIEACVEERFEVSAGSIFWKTAL